MIIDSHAHAYVKKERSKNSILFYGTAPYETNFFRWKRDSHGSTLSVWKSVQRYPAYTEPQTDRSRKNIILGENSYQLYYYN